MHTAPDPQDPDPRETVFRARGLAKVGVHLFRRGIRQPRTRKEPVEIGVNDPRGVTAVLARAARSQLGVGGAEKRVREPECDALLADPPGAVKQDGLREHAAPSHVLEPRLQCLVTEEWDDGHPGKLRGARRRCTPDGGRLMCTLTPHP